MTDTTRDWRRLALPLTICLALCLPGCHRDTPEKFIASGKAYLEQFYRTIDRPGDVKRAFIDGCVKRAYM